MRVDASKNREYQARWYKANKRTQYARIKERQKFLTQWFAEYKRTISCSKCGESNPVCLDFHHVDPTNKRTGRLSLGGAIRTKGWGLKRIQEEISKCIVLCANCHRKEHAQCA